MKLSVFLSVLLLPPLAMAQTAGDTPIHLMSPGQLDRFLAETYASPANLNARLRLVAESSLGQPHQADTLGEGNFDAHDPRPLVALDRSDARSFVEQTLAMSLSPDYPSFWLLLQRLRYRDGVIATANRNHNLVADWAPNNAWLLEDITRQLAEGMAWIPLHQVVRRRSMLLDTYGLDVAVPDEKFIDGFIPRVYLSKVLGELQSGDVVLVITGSDRQQFCEEMGVLVSRQSRDERPADQRNPSAVAPPVSGQWYNVTHDAYATVSPASLDGLPAIEIGDGGYTNGVYSVFEQVVPGGGSYFLRANVKVLECEKTDGLSAYQMGVVVNGRHRPPGETDLPPLEPQRPDQAVGNFQGLTDGDDSGLDVQAVVTGTFRAAAGDTLLVAFSSDLQSGDFNQYSDAWKDTRVMVSGLELVPGVSPLDDGAGETGWPIPLTVNAALPDHPGSARWTIVASAAPAVEATGLSTMVWQRRDVLGFKFLRPRPEAFNLAAAETARMAATVTPPSP